jgi:outer membrane protein assembly factor BamD (BamD/ComL family)
MSAAKAANGNSPHFPQYAPFEHQSSGLALRVPKGGLVSSIMRFFRSTQYSYFLLTLAGVGAAFTAEIQEIPEFRAAQQALQDGLPAVAAIKAARLMAEAPAKSIGRQTLATLAVESWVRAQDGISAMKVIQQEKIANQAYWQAQALFLNGDLDGAEKLLSERVNQGQAPSLERLLLAKIILKNGHEAQARAVIQPVLKSSDPEMARRAQQIADELNALEGKSKPVSPKEVTSSQEASPLLLQAESLIHLDKPLEAQTILRGILASKGGGERAHHAASVLLADSYLHQKNLTKATEVLIQFLDNTLESEAWSPAFDLLARSLEATEKGLPPPDATLRWISEGNTVQKDSLATLPSTNTFQGHAMLLLSRWLVSQGRPLEALGMLEAVIQLHEGHPQSDDAMRLALETYSTLKIDARVSALTVQWRKRFGNSGSSMVESVSAGTAFKRGDYQQACALFQTAANLATTLAERRAALYNAGASALRAGKMVLFKSMLGQLQVASAETALPSQDGSIDLDLDSTLELAAKGHPEAEAELTRITQKQPPHPRAIEAWLALAELAILRAPADFPLADKAFKMAESWPGITEAQRQRALTTRLWQLDRQGQLKALTEVGAHFLSKWPMASQAAQVRMKIADAFFRLENFAAARTEFELVAKNHPSSPYADTALYFAGMSAVSMMSDEGRASAITLWQEVAEKKGPLSISARQQQALAKRRGGQEAEALKMLDALLKEKSLSEELQRSLTCEKAEILMLLGKEDGVQLNAAIQVLQEALHEDDLPYQWRARLGYTLAVALNSAGRGVEALEACYDVVKSTGFTGPADPNEFRWFYRAGFFGIELIEAGKQWEAAALLAETLSQSKGDRAIEAKERATKIRLEHFLWDGK